MASNNGLLINRKARSNARVKAFHKIYYLTRHDCGLIDEQMLKYKAQVAKFEKLIERLQGQVNHFNIMAQEMRLKRDDMFEQVLQAREEFIEAQNQYLNDWRTGKK